MITFQELLTKYGIAHFGVKGMKWGVRKSDSSSSSGSSSPFPSAKKLSDSELQAFVNRLNLERQYNSLVAQQPQPQKSAAARFVKTILGDVGKRQVSRLASSAADLAIEAALGKSKNPNVAAVGKELQRVRTKKK